MFSAQENYQIPSLQNEYLGKNRVRVAIPSRKLVWEYELEVSNYNKNDEPAEEEIKKGFSPDWVDPFSGYELADLDGDGTVELIGRQRVCGIAHVDVFGELRQVFAWNGDRFILKDIWLYQNGATPKRIKPL
ncbi:hypothetical protein SY88_05615 [Clostridiales bacterium PH28_bin88]|nr:hypothetical protein SY88_05615 [Clostridiales bacterium PH28_bin88]